MYLLLATFDISDEGGEVWSLSVTFSSSFALFEHLLDFGFVIEPARRYPGRLKR